VCFVTFSLSSCEFDYKLPERLVSKCVVWHVKLTIVMSFAFVKEGTLTQLL